MSSESKNVGEELTVRRATTRDQPAILELMRTSLGTGSIPRNAAYWRWKHVDNPFGASPVLIAEAGGEIVGLRVFMRWTWQSGEHQLRAVRAVDTATHPDWRGRGIFTKLTLQLVEEMRREGVAFIFNTPNAKSRPGYLKMGWEVVGRPTLWVRPVKPVRIARALFQGALKEASEEPPPLEALPPVSNVLDRPAVKALLQSVAESPTPTRALHTPVNAAYLAWRYAHVPAIDYSAVSRGSGAAGALVVVGARRRGMLRELRVCEIVTGPAKEAVQNARALLRGLAHLKDVDAVIAMAPQRRSSLQVLLASGYLPAPRTGPLLTSYPLSNASPDPRHLSSWCPSIGNVELF